MVRRRNRNSEGGAALVEFALTASFFFLVICAIVSGSHLFFTHNAMVEATRRGARYAATRCKPNLTGCPDSANTVTKVKDMVLYGTDAPANGATPLVYNLQATQVTVTYSPDFAIAAGTVSVQIDGYQYVFAVGGITLNMPTYTTTVTGESAGFVPGVYCPNP